MGYLEYPKVVKRHDDQGNIVDEKVVADAAAYEAAVAEGYQGPPPPPVETEAQRKASPAYLEYPKVLRHADGRELIVANADAEAAEAANGFAANAPAAVVSDASVDAPADGETPKRKPGRPKKSAE